MWVINYLLYSLVNLRFLGCMLLGNLILWSKGPQSKDQDEHFPWESSKFITPPFLPLPSLLGGGEARVSFSTLLQDPVASLSVSVLLKTHWITSDRHLGQTGLSQNEIYLFKKLKRPGIDLVLAVAGSRDSKDASRMGIFLPTLRLCSSLGWLYSWAGSLHVEDPAASGHALPAQ